MQHRLGFHATLAEVLQSRNAIVFFVFFPLVTRMSSAIDGRTFPRTRVLGVNEKENSLGTEVDDG
jgi:hypothetical protein